MNVTRALGVAVVSATVAGLLSAGPAVASARTGSTAAATGWSAVPAAARGPITRAIAAADPAYAAPALHPLELDGPANIADEQFGTSVAVSADTIVVGAPYAGPSSGEAFVFRRPAAGWANVRQVATLEPSDGASNDIFGTGLAISGTTIVVAAPNHLEGSNGYQGVLYVYNEPKAGWSGTLRQSAELVDSAGAPGDELGDYSVAISGDTVAAAAGYRKVGTTLDQGVVDVFVRPKSGWSGTVHQMAQLTASDGASNDELGFGAVGISGDTIVAGAGSHQVGANSQQGAVYVFVRPKFGWSGTHEQSAELTASDGDAHDDLGYESVGISGATVVAGAGEHEVGSDLYQGAGYVWVRPTAGWSGTQHQSAELVASDGAFNDNLGADAIAISGRAVAAAAPDREVGTHDDQGSVYTFTEPAHGWSGTVKQTSESVGPSGADSDQLGQHAAVAIFGSTVVAGSHVHDIGANDDGVAYLFAPARPTLSSLKESKQSWRAGTRRTVLNPAHKPRPGGTRFSFSLAQAGAVTVRLDQHGTSIRTLTVAAPQGHSALYFYGRLTAKKSLPIGRYTAWFSTSNSAGDSTRQGTNFRVRR
jgi:FG-GAP repeat